MLRETGVSRSQSLEILAEFDFRKLPTIEKAEYARLTVQVIVDSLTNGHYPADAFRALSALSPGWQESQTAKQAIHPLMIPHLYESNGASRLLKGHAVLLPLLRDTLRNCLTANEARLGIEEILTKHPRDVRKPQLELLAELSDVIGIELVDGDRGQSI